MSDGIIGSVGVSVVPDAQDFWRRFQAQTRTGGVESGRRAGEDWSRGFQGTAGRQEVTVRVNSKQAQKDTSLLATSLLALAPAVVPLAGAAALGGAALVSMGAVGAIAVSAIGKEMKKGTKAGTDYIGVVGQLKADIGQLQGVVARGILPGVDAGVTKLNRSLPQLNAFLGQTAKITGDTFQHLVGGFVGGLGNFGGELLNVEHGVDRLAARFEAWATGPGGARFAQGLATDFQHVGPLLEHLSGALAHVIAAGNVPGLAVVDELDTLSKVLEAIPTPILTALITGITALKTAALVSTLVDKLAVSIRGVAVAEDEAAAASSTRGGLAGAVGFLGKVGATWLGASIAIDAYSKATDNARTSSDGFSRIAAQTGHVLDDLVHLNLKGAAGYLFGGASKDNAIAAQNKELADSYAVLTHQVVTFTSSGVKAQDAATKDLTAHSIDLIASLSAGHAVYTQLSVGQQITNEQTKDLARNTAALASVFDSLHGKLGGGTAVSQAVSGFTAAQSAVQASIASGEKFVKLGGDVQDTYKGVNITLGMYKAALARTGSDAAAIGYIRAQIDALNQNKDALQQLSDESANVSTYVTDVGTKYKLTSDQIDLYTAALGLNITEIAKGGAALHNAEVDLGNFVYALKNGSTTLDGWLAAVAQFTKSADTAADRASLIGAALRASNGDMLSYANTMVQAATANQQLVTDFKNLKDGVLNLKTGAIDFHNAAAAPLLSDLQNLQTAAVNNAAAVYQHFNALGDAGAADKAFRTYVDDTQGALRGQASQLGLTDKQAKKLSDRYFGIKNSGDLRKQIELLGGDKVQQALQGILDDLDVLAGKKTVLSVEIDTHNRHVPAGSQGGPVRVKAAGGFVAGPGTGTSDSIPARLSNGEFVVNARQTAKHRAMLESLNSAAQGFAAGGLVGGPSNPFTGVDYSGSNATSRNPRVTKGPGPTYTVAGQNYSTLQSAENAAKRLFKAQVTLGVRIDDKDLTSFRAALSGTVAQAQAAFATLYADARKLGVSDALAKTLRTENSRLDVVIGDRNRAADRLKTVMEKFTQIHDSVMQAGQGAFDVTTAGTGFNGQQSVTFANLQAQQTQAANLVSAWAAGIRRLAATFGKSAAGKEYLQQLAEGGPSDYPEVKALLSADPKSLANFASTQAKIDSTSAGLGSFVGNQLFGSQIAGLQKEIRVDDRSIKALGAEISRQVEHAVAQLADQPINVRIGDEVIYRASKRGEKKAGRRGVRA